MSQTIRPIESCVSPKSAVHVVLLSKISFFTKVLRRHAIYEDAEKVEVQGLLAKNIVSCETFKCDFSSAGSMSY
jgi:hypothetical protein